METSRRRSGTFTTGKEILKLTVRTERPNSSSSSRKNTGSTDPAGFSGSSVSNKLGGKREFAFHRHLRESFYRLNDFLNDTDLLGLSDGVVEDDLQALAEQQGTQEFSQVMSPDQLREALRSSTASGRTFDLSAGPRVSVTYPTEAPVVLSSSPSGARRRLTFGNEPVVGRGSWSQSFRRLTESPLCVDVVLPDVSSLQVDNFRQPRAWKISPPRGTSSRKRLGSPSSGSSAKRPGRTFSKMSLSRKWSSPPSSVQSPVRPDKTFSKSSRRPEFMPTKGTPFPRRPRVKTGKRTFIKSSGRNRLKKAFTLATPVSKRSKVRSSGRKSTEKHRKTKSPARRTYTLTARTSKRKTKSPAGRTYTLTARTLRKTTRSPVRRTYALSAIKSANKAKSLSRTYTKTPRTLRKKTKSSPSRTYTLSAIKSAKKAKSPARTYTKRARTSRRKIKSPAKGTYTLSTIQSARKAKSVARRTYTVPVNQSRRHRKSPALGTYTVTPRKTKTSTQSPSTISITPLRTRYISPSGRAFTIKHLSTKRRFLPASRRSPMSSARRSRMRSARKSSRLSVSPARGGSWALRHRRSTKTPLRSKTPSHGTVVTLATSSRRLSLSTSANRTKRRTRIRPKRLHFSSSSPRKARSTGKLTMRRYPEARLSASRSSKRLSITPKRLSFPLSSLRRSKTKMGLSPLTTSSANRKIGTQLITPRRLSFSKFSHRSSLRRLSSSTSANRKKRIRVTRPGRLSFKTAGGQSSKASPFTHRPPSFARRAGGTLVAAKTTTTTTPRRKLPPTVGRATPPRRPGRSAAQGRNQKTPHIIWNRQNFKAAILEVKRGKRASVPVFVLNRPTRDGKTRETIVVSMPGELPVREKNRAVRETVAAAMALKEPWRDAVVKIN